MKLLLSFLLCVKTETFKELLNTINICCLTKLYVHPFFSSFLLMGRGFCY